MVPLPNQTSLTQRTGSLLPSSPSIAVIPPTDMVERPKLIPRPSLHQEHSARNFYSRSNVSNTPTGRHSDDSERSRKSQVIGDWAQRREQAKHTPPTSVHNYIGRLRFELDRGEAFDSNETLETGGDDTGFRI